MHAICVLTSSGFNGRVPCGEQLIIAPASRAGRIPAGLSVIAVTMIVRPCALRQRRSLANDTNLSASSSQLFRTNVNNPAIGRFPQWSCKQHSQNFCFSLVLHRFMRSPRMRPSRKVIRRKKEELKKHVSVRTSKKVSIGIIAPQKLGMICQTTSDGCTHARMSLYCSAGRPESVLAYSNRSTTKRIKGFLKFGCTIDPD